MAPELYSVSVPGSLMLMGEHAVLYGKQAIVCAVDKRLHMNLIPNTSTIITIQDTRLGTLSQELNALQVQAPFVFVLQAIKLFADKIPSGFTLEINSEFSSVIGFGSSAAVTVATVSILAQWLNIPLSPDQIFQMAKDVVITVQGFGSGADVAASVFGGVISYSMCATGERTRKHIDTLQLIPNFTAIYCGYKTPTPEVIKRVHTAEQREPKKFADLFAQMHECVLQAQTAIQQSNWPLLGNLFNEHQQLQSAIGTSNELLDQLVHLLNAQPAIYGAKISGSGLGDCVIGLGAVQQQIISANDGMLQFPVAITEQGLSYASN